MWRFDDERSPSGAWACIGASRNGYESGAMLHRETRPRISSALERERVVAADDARTDPRTREFRDGYLVPHGIGAMLDVPLRHDNATVGVLCAEHVGGTRAWTVDEQNFAISVANLIVVAIADEERRQALDAARRKRGAGAAHRRHGARRVHRHRLGGRHRRLECAGGADVRLDARRGARPEPGRDDHPAGVSRRAQQRHAALSRDRRGAGRQPAPRADGAAPVGARVPGRAHHHLADAASRTATSSARSSATSPIAASATTSCAAPRSRPKPRPGPRASSWPT